MWYLLEKRGIRQTSDDICSITGIETVHSLSCSGEVDHIILFFSQEENSRPGLTRKKDVLEKKIGRPKASKYPNQTHILMI